MILLSCCKCTLVAIFLLNIFANANICVIFDRARVIVAWQHYDGPGRVREWKSSTDPHKRGKVTIKFGELIVSSDFDSGRGCCILKIWNKST